MGVPAVTKKTSPIVWLLAVLALVTLMPSAKAPVEASDDPSLWIGHGAPPAALGAVGDLWVDHTPSNIFVYGPKLVPDMWPTPCVIPAPEAPKATVCRLGNGGPLRHTGL